MLDTFAAKEEQNKITEQKGAAFLQNDQALSEEQKEQLRSKLALQAVPNITASFRLKYFSVSLVNNKEQN